MADQPHPEAQRVIERADERRFPSVDALSVESARDRLERLFATQPAEPVADTVEFSIPGPETPVPVRVYEPEADPPYPVLVYYHGGGFVAGSLDTHDNVCAALTNRADCLTVSVDYRRAPEHPFPAAVADAYAAAEWASTHADQLRGDPDRVAVAGDSAGGNLAAVTALLARDRDGPALCHHAPIYPVLASPDLQTFPSHEENAEGYLLEMAHTEWYLDNYAGPLDARNAYLAPLLAEDLSDLPPATVVTAGFDLHRDEGLAYVDRLDAAGVDATSLHYEGMIHGFVSLFEHVSRGERAIEALADRLVAAFG